MTPGQGSKLNHVSLFGMYGELIYLIKYACILEIMYITFPINILLSEMFPLYFLIGSQSEEVSPKFLFFMFLLSYIISVYI